MSRALSNVGKLPTFLTLVSIFCVVEKNIKTHDCYFATVGFLYLGDIFGDGDLSYDKASLANKIENICNNFVFARSREPTVMRGFSQLSTKTKNTVQPQGFTVFLVEATGIEPTTSASRTLRATSCATPRIFYLKTKIL